VTAPLENLEARLGYRFRESHLLVRALTHRSRCSELPTLADNSDNEQLEFLGDSVLGFVASEALVVRHPGAREGRLSQLKSHLVSSTHLHRCALELGLGEYLLLGRGEERSGGRERKALLADSLEAVIAAIYLDGGIEAARTFIRMHVLTLLEDPEHIDSIGQLNYKSALQERALALGLPIPRYSTAATTGPEHAKIFTIEAKVGDQHARGTGSSKKSASQKAAQLLLEKLVG